MRDLLSTREALGHKTQLRLDCEQLVSEDTIEAFLRSVRCVSLVEACHLIYDGNESQLRTALIRFKDEQEVEA